MNRGRSDCCRNSISKNSRMKILEGSEKLMFLEVHESRRTSLTYFAYTQTVEWIHRTIAQCSRRFFSIHPSVTAIRAREKGGKNI